MIKMTRTEFLKKTEHYQGRVGDWDIVLDDYSLADYVLGCYYDQNTKLWKVYKTGERGIGGIRLETSSEEKALDKLYSMIEYENEINSHNKEWEAKNKNQT